MEITLEKFPTHLPKTRNKHAPNKMQKLNGQAIYNDTVSRFTRAILMDNIHNYLIPRLRAYKQEVQREFDNGTLEFPIVVVLNIYTPINHGNIQLRKGKLTWKPAAPDFEPTWDIDNLSSIWMKGVKDSIVKSGLIPDDNVKYVRGGGYLFYEVEDIEDRRLVIKLKTLK
jgi:Holliday junction resolvase RusA-like endonuclease